MLALLMLLCAAAPVQALDWPKGFQAARHQRFKPDARTGLAANPGFIAARFDLSGIGWDSRDMVKTVALLSPRHFLGARHFQLKGSVTFMGRDGKLRSYEVEKQVPLGKGNDICIGVLKEPVRAQDKISYFPVAGDPSLEAYVGHSVYYFGQSGGVGRANVFLVKPDKDMSFFFYHAGTPPRDAPADQALGINNDSGSPSFLAQGGKLLLIGHHSANNRDSFLPGYLDAVDKVLAADGFKLARAPVKPGPGRWWKKDPDQK